MEFNIKEVCKKLNITKDTLYYYEDEGLLPKIERNAIGYRVYTEDDISHIYLILCLRDIDIPIRLIKNYVDLLEKSDGAIQQRKEMVLNFKAIIADKIKKYKKTQFLLDKKLDFLIKTEHENVGSNELKCYDYRAEWESFKNLFEEENFYEKND